MSNIKLISLTKTGDDSYELVGELTHAQVHVLLDIGINTSIKAGVLYIDQNVLDDKDDDDEQQEFLFVHEEPKKAQ